MLEKPSLMTRTIVGKSVGFAFGLLGLFLLPLVLPDAGWMLRIGSVLWYTTLGAIVAVFGVFDYHPVLKLPLPWWLMGPAVGAWMNLLVTLFAYESFAADMLTAFGPDGPLRSPFWFCLEGAIAGWLIAFFAQRFGGIGPATAGR